MTTSKCVLSIVFTCVLMLLHSVHECSSFHRLAAVTAPAKHTYVSYLAAPQHPQSLSFVPHNTLSHSSLSRVSFAPPASLIVHSPRLTTTRCHSTQLSTIAKDWYIFDLLIFLMFQVSHKHIFSAIYRTQRIVWKWFTLGEPREWSTSIVYFLQQRFALLAKIFGVGFVIKFLLYLTTLLGLRLPQEFPSLILSLLCIGWFAQGLDLFNIKFFPIIFPKIAENRRQSYVVSRSITFSLWCVAGLVCCEMVSSYLKIPLSSTLAFGGFGGLVIGLSAKDITANFLGGMLLLLNEPFTPGDMVTFKSGSEEIVGRVERVGWAQTRIRGRDTTPTYVPNSQFVHTPITNMERITHRKFETSIPIRTKDIDAVHEVTKAIRNNLRTVPKLDSLSMPFRVNFAAITTIGFNIEVLCYFATKSIDEFLTLQQSANVEILRALRDSNVEVAMFPFPVIGGEVQLLA